MLSTRELARLLTGIENRDPAALSTLASMPPGNSLVIGITGPPGAGKSSLVDALTAELRKNQTVAILAVDPSSRSTGGAILGDRIRMQKHHADPGVFIRSTATRGAIGGLSGSTDQLSKLFSAAGFDYVLIETVGVGQDEVEIARLADLTVVVLVPGMGDDVQAIKAGIMEIADVFVINKSDKPGADQTQHDIEAMLSLNAHGSAPPIFRTVATESQGISDLIELLKQHKPRQRDPIELTFTIDHLGVAVNSISDALRFYESSLGMSVASRETVQHEGVYVAMLPAGESRIELLEPASSTSPVAKFIDRRGPGLHHVALRVPDLNAAIERLQAAGCRVLGTPQRGAGGHLYVFVHPASTGGVLWELIQQ